MILKKLEQSWHEIERVGAEAEKLGADIGVLTVIAGPNGAGKSTIYRLAKPDGRFINADEIEASMPPPR